MRGLIADMKKAGKPPGTGGFITGAAAIDAIVSAISRTGSTDGKKLAAAVEQFRGLPTISGNISFSPTLHSVFGRVYRVIHVENNVPKYVGLISTPKPVNIG